MTNDWQQARDTNAEYESAVASYNQSPNSQVKQTAITLKSTFCISLFSIKETKLISIDQATDHNPEYEPSSIYDGMDNENQEDTKAHDNTYDNMYEDN